MADLEYTVTNQGISTSKTSRLVSGTIGVYTVKFTFNNVWDGLEKWATFDPIPGTPYKQPLDANGECTIPGEVMGGVYLRIGVFGLAEGQAYPTIWASKLPLEEGCFVNVPPSDWPEPSPLLEDVVKVSEQTFTDAQKAQARTNIGAAGSADMATALAGKVDKPENAVPGNVAIIDTNRNIADSGKSLLDIYDSAMISKTVSGDIVTIEDGANVPVKTMTIGINPLQAGSGVPSPSNVRAISGWTKSKIKRYRKNLLYDTANGDAYHGITMTRNADGSYHVSGTPTSSITARMPIKGSTPIKLPQGTYTVSVNSDFAGTGTSTFRMYYEYHVPNTETWSGTTLVNGATSNTIVTDGIRNFRLQIYQTTAIDITIKPQIEIGSVAHEFESYIIDCNTYEIEFPSEAGTVYGGSLTVNEDGTGVLTVNRGIATLDGSSDETITKINVTGYYCYTISLPSDCLAVNVQTDDVQFNWLSASNSGSNYAGNIISNKRANIRTPSTDSNFTDVTAVRSYLASNPLQVVYPLEEPVTYTLTAPQVNLLLGLNNIWADTGSIESLTYHADPTIAMASQAKAIKLSIAKGVEDGFTASQAYVADDIFYVGDTLYRATTSIANGAVITPNTNCVKTTIMEYVEYALYG